MGLWFAACVACVGSAATGVVRWGSLSVNSIGVEGGRAIGAGLQHLPSLTKLEYVRCMSWHVDGALGCERMGMAGLRGRVMWRVVEVGSGCVWSVCVLLCVVCM